MPKNLVWVPFNPFSGLKAGQWQFIKDKVIYVNRKQLQLNDACLNDAYLLN